MGVRIEGRPTWAEIDLSALRRNFREVRTLAAGRRVIAVVKADAYGHGALPVARTLLDEGCAMLAVATVAEARELRGAGIAAPLLLLQGIHDPADADSALARALVPVVSAAAELEPLDAAGRRAGRPFPVHLKVDTGMTRLGVVPEELDAVLGRLRELRGVRLDGVLSHLAEADDAHSPATTAQRERFALALRRVFEVGFRPTWIHLDASPALVRGPTPGTDAVRTGLLLYGADPTREGGHALEPVMTLQTRVLLARDVAAGTRVGYGGTWTAPRATRILLLPLGYADGLPRAAGAAGFEVDLGERRAPLVGRVSMDLAAVDGGPGARERAGHAVLVFGRRAGRTLRVDELARAVDTIPYEILVRIGPRVPRIPVGS